MNATVKSSEGMATASLILGIFALVTSFTILPTGALAALAITLSWLSRGNGKMSGKALAGDILAVISLIIAATLIAMGIAWIVKYLATYYQQQVLPSLKYLMEQYQQMLDSLVKMSGPMGGAL